MKRKSIADLVADVPLAATFLRDGAPIAALQHAQNKRKDPSRADALASVRSIFADLCSRAGLPVPTDVGYAICGEHGADYERLHREAGAQFDAQHPRYSAADAAEQTTVISGATLNFPIAQVTP